MSDVGGIGGINGPNSSFSSGPVTAAAALTALRRHPSSTVEISDTVQNIAKNLDALQAYAAKITTLSTTDANQKMAVTGSQYAKDQGILTVWAATAGQTVGIVGAKAAMAGSLASYVTSASVSDTTGNIQRYLNNLETLASSGVLTEIVQSGNPGNLTITKAQLAADQDALDKIRNHGYTLAITNASVSDVLGLDSQTPLSTNAKVKAISIVDTTVAISDNLDALQRVGLRIKTITQTDPTAQLTVTGDQYKQDKLVLGKIVTSDLLAVIDASATQAKSATHDPKVVSIDIHDTASNISRNWALLNSLVDLTSVQVSDQANAIQVTSDQFAAGSTLLGKFTDSYKLKVTNVSAGSALAVANTQNVDSVDVLDSAANLTANMADLKTIDGQGNLGTITLSDPRTPMSMDVSLLQGSELDSTQSVLDKINGHNYKLAVTGAATSALADLAANKRVVSVAVSDSSANIAAALTTLHQLGSRLSLIEQTDIGAAYSLTQAQLEAHASVLSKIAGGYSTNLTGVTAAKAAADALNMHVASITVSDTGRNILSRWADLRALGTTLNSISQSDGSALSISADNYQLGVHDNLVAKLAGATFSVTGASLVQAQAIGSDVAVAHIDVTEDGSVIAGNLTALGTLLTGTKLRSITNQTPTTSLSLDASQLTTGSQAVLDLIKGGSYTLALGGVDVAAAKDLLANNHKIATVAVTGVAADIVSNLPDLSTLGRKLTTITQTDAPAETIDMTGETFQKNAGALAKIEGGFLAVLSDVTAAQATSFATNPSIRSMTVSDTGANLANAWGSLSEVRAKLTEVTQSDTSTLQLGANDWLQGQGLRAKFTSEPTVSVSGADVSQVDGLATDDAVTAIQVSDSSNAVAGALADLVGVDKITQVVLQDPTAVMDLSATTYADSAAVLALVKNHQYSVALSDVAAQDVATLATDTHVATMDVNDTSSEVSSNFAALIAATNLNSIQLSDENGAVTLTASQILDNPDTLAKISGSYQLAATDVTMLNLSGVQDVPQVSSISISDTSGNVAANFSDILALGDTLAHIHLSDGSPVLSLSQQDWTAGTDALATIDDTYQVDVTDTAAGDAQVEFGGGTEAHAEAHRRDNRAGADAQAAASDGTVRHVLVSDTASGVAGNWDTLVGLYNSGTGKLTEISLSDSNPLILTADQQFAGAAMITALLPDETIQTAP